MARIALSIVLGLFTLVVSIGIGESVQSTGVVTEAIASGLAVALYLMMAEFLVAPRGSRGLRGKWSTMIAMVAPVLIMCVVVIVAEERRVWMSSAFPLLVSGCLGISAGAALAGCVTFRAMPPASCRRLMLASAALLAAVVIMLVVGVIPLTAKAGTFADGTPGATVSLLGAFGVLNALVAACLWLFGFRVRHDNPPASGALAVLAFLTFISAWALAPSAFAFRGHGPVLLTASNLALVCLVAEIVVTALVSSAALRLAKTGDA